MNETPAANPTRVNSMMIRQQVGVFYVGVGVLLQPVKRDVAFGVTILYRLLEFFIIFSAADDRKGDIGAFIVELCHGVYQSELTF